jgi:hypothetical protein
MRRKELTAGIQVRDSHGEIVGTSKKAGFKGVSQTATSRIVSAFPVMFLPGLIMTQLEKTKFLKTNQKLIIPLNLFIISSCLMLALPPSIALFPQIAELNLDGLEDSFKGMKDSKGYDLKTVYFNRGL